MDSTVLFVVLCLLAVSTPLGLAEEVALTGSLPAGLKLYVDKRGCAIRFYRESSSANKTGQITASIYTITEVDANGKKITGQGHSVTNVNQITFSNSQVTEDVTLQPGVHAGSIQLNGSLPDVGTGANVSLTVYAIKNNGTLTQDGEVTSVYIGQVKFSLSIAGWSFADGAYLDVEVNFKIPPGRAAIASGSSTSNKPAKFDLGEGAYAEFSKKVSCDGTWKNMNESYPKVTSSGANNIVTLRLPRFNFTVSYDPVMSAGDPPADTQTTGGAAAIVSSATLHLCIVVGAFLAALFIHKA